MKTDDVPQMYKEFKTTPRVQLSLSNSNWILSGRLFRKDQVTGLSLVKYIETSPPLRRAPDRSHLK